MSANYENLSATKQVKIGLGKLKSIFVSSGTNPTVAIYDSATASDSDPKIIAQFTATAPAVYNLTGDVGGVNFSRGLYVVLGGTSPVISVFYE
jgi:Neuraminidase (sialidase)